MRNILKNSNNQLTIGNIKQHSKTSNFSSIVLEDKYFNMKRMMVSHFFCHVRGATASAPRTASKVQRPVVGFMLVKVFFFPQRKMHMHFDYVVN